MGLAAGRGGAQSVTTAERAVTPSVFAGVTAVETGLDHGRNLSVTAGLDVGFLPDARVQLALEYRGTYAVDKGGIDSIKTNMGGVKVSKRVGHFAPYVTLLAGRGETTFANGGFQVPNTLVFYLLSSSNVFSLGGGVDVVTLGHLALKVDAQGQRFSSPVTASGHLYSEVGTVGLVYTFRIGRGAR
jgi:hypothetical protein